MRNRFVVLLLLAVPALSFAQSFAGTDAIETVGQGKINWTIGEVYATGIGAPPSRAVNPAQARAMAERAAMVVALRNLLEIVKGVRVDSETVVENFMIKNDVVRTRVSGIVRGAVPVRKRYLSDGSVEMTVGMKMKGAFLNAIVPPTFGSHAIVPAPSVQPALPSSPSTPLPPAVEPRTTRPAPPAATGTEPKPAPAPIRPAPPAPSPSNAASGPSTAQFRGGKATGVVIDGRGLGLRPALLPKVIDAAGKEIYVGKVVTRTNAVEQGVAGYAKDVNAAERNFRVTDNPLIIKGIRASGATKTDIVLSSADAQALRDLSTQGDFLQYCRVIIVY